MFSVFFEKADNALELSLPTEMYFPCLKIRMKNTAYCRVKKKYFFLHIVQ